MHEPAWGRTKQILIWPNGCYQDVKRIFINPQHAKTWNIILNFVTVSLKPTFGPVYYIFELSTKKKIRSFIDLKDNERYVAVGSDGRLKLGEKYREPNPRLMQKSSSFYKEPEGPNSETSLQLNSTSRRTHLVIYVFANGEKKDPIKVVLKWQDFENWDVILNFMARKLDIPIGIEFLTTITGKAICRPEELQHGRVYVGLPFLENFKRLDYMGMFFDFITRRKKLYDPCVAPMYKTDLKQIIGKSNNEMPLQNQEAIKKCGLVCNPVQSASHLKSGMNALKNTFSNIMYETPFDSGTSSFDEEVGKKELAVQVITPNWVFPDPVHSKRNVKPKSKAVMVNFTEFLYGDCKTNVIKVTKPSEITENEAIVQAFPNIVVEKVSSKENINFTISSDLVALATEKLCKGIIEDDDLIKEIDDIAANSNNLNRSLDYITSKTNYVFDRSNTSVMDEEYHFTLKMKNDQKNLQNGNNISNHKTEKKQRNIFHQLSSASNESFFAQEDR